MCTHNQCFEQKSEKILEFHLKINIFTAVKYCCILHRLVVVMNTICNIFCIIVSLMHMFQTRLVWYCSGGRGWHHQSLQNVSGH